MYEIVKLGSVIDLVMGQAPPGSKCNKEGIGIPFVKAGEFSKINPIIKEWTTEPKKYGEQGDVFLCVVGATCGKINLGIDCAIGRSVAALRPNPCQIDQKYLYYFMSQMTQTLRNNSLGAAQTVISKDMINKIDIQLPPLTEQKRIVAKLDGAFTEIGDMIRYTNCKLEELNNFFKRELKKTFSEDESEFINLEYLANITSSKRVLKSHYVKIGVPFYRTKEIKELANGESIETKLFISREQYDQFKKKFGVPKIGDVLITAIGTIGEVYVVQNGDEFYFKDGNILWLRNISGLNSYYLRYSLINLVGEIKKLSSGSTYSALPIHRLKKHKIPIKSLSNQNRSVLKLDKLSKLMNQIVRLNTAKITALEELKKSLLKKELTTYYK